MKIFLPFAVKEIGGTSTFARKFKEGMESAGHEVTFEFCSDYDVLFLIVQCPLKYLIDAKKRGKKIVQRLDGTYYWTVSGWKFPLMNAKAAYIRHLFTDFTIYQSRYSLESARRFLGRKRNDRNKVIYNGVDLHRFSPEGKKILTKSEAGETILFTASAFRRKDQIVPMLEAVKMYRKKFDKNIKLYIAGNFVGAVSNFPEQLKKLKYVTYLGKIPNNELPSYVRSSDVFLFTHLNPPCPNNVIEALACGLPICGIDDGAMPELVQQDENGRLAHSPGTGYWQPRHYDIEQFATNLQAIVKNKKRYHQKSREKAETLYSLTTMIDNYLTVFRDLIR